VPTKFRAILVKRHFSRKYAAAQAHRRGIIFVFKISDFGLMTSLGDERYDIFTLT
jgi:hypothetical protein